MRPLIGITSYVEQVSWGDWTEEAAVAPFAYVRSVETAGGRALVIPPSDEGLDETLDVLDGVVFSGGGDLNPRLYDAEPHPETDTPREARDRAELRMLQAALERDMPVLAICRGSQLLNVARGGDLIQHLPEEVGHDQHREDPGTFSDHAVEVAADSRLGRLVGTNAPVKSHHHQGIGRIGEGLREVAWAEDGVVEGLEDPAQRFALGVLWHAEEGEDGSLFRGFVDEARRYRAERS
jgi:putative glutamine amidotransferase